MNFEQLLKDVYDITNRPSLEAETSSAIRLATLKAHHLDFFSRDIVEVPIKFNEKLFKQSIDLYKLAANYRAAKYFRLTDTANCDDVIGPFITMITPDEILDSYGRNRVNVSYVAGRMLEIRANVDFNTAIFGFYVNPIVTPSGSYDSWIANIHPGAIINEAARVIFKMIGYDEQSAQYNTLVNEEYALVRITGLSDIGY
jgi:hypothetical protein